MFITASPLTVIETAFTTALASLRTKISAIHEQHRDTAAQFINSGAETDTKPFQGLL